MKTYIAIGQTNGGGVWHYVFATRQEARQFVKAVNALDFLDHQAYRICWDVIPAWTSTVEQALDNIKGIAKDLT